MSPKEKRITLMIILLAILACIVLIATLSSASLIITPSPMNVTSKVNEQNTFTATFQNTFPFAIQDFSYSNLSGFTFPQIILQPNQTATINFTVQKSSPESTLINSLVKFNYLVSVPSSPQTFNINITPTGFSPSFLVIHEQDTVIWTNTDSITHTVTSSLYDLNVAPNQSVQRIFTQVGTSNYQDLILFFGASIEILNRSQSQAVHNPLYDTNWQINLLISAEPTTLQVESVDTTSFTVADDGSAEGLFKIKNTGSNSAQTVHITADKSWLIFDVNDFVLASGEQKFVKYKIEPFIIETNETNKNYTINIKSKALNTEEVTFAINVFIPFKDIDIDSSNPARLGDILQRFCRENPEACVPSTGGNGTTTVIDPSVQFNFTTSQILDILRRQRQAEDALERTSNRLATVEALLSSSIPESNKLLNESLALQLQNKEDQENMSDYLFIVGFFVLIAGGLVIFLKKYKKFDSKRNIEEGF